MIYHLCAKLITLKNTIYSNNYKNLEHFTKRAIGKNTFLSKHCNPQVFIYYIITIIIIVTISNKFNSLKMFKGFFTSILFNIISKRKVTVCHADS